MNAFQTVSMDDVRRVAARAGSHWFEPQALRFFKCRLPETAVWLDAGTADDRADGLGTYLFASSEQGPDGVRRWSVRRAVVAREPQESDGYMALRFQVETVGEFQGHATAARARAALKLAVVLALAGTGDA